MVKYNETEKILLLSKYITSGMDARSFALSCGVAYTTFLNFCREYGNPDLSSIHELMKKENIPTTVEELQALLAKLREERLRSLANSTMIDLAEKRFNIPIRKKSGAK